MTSIERKNAEAFSHLLTPSHTFYCVAQVDTPESRPASQPESGEGAAEEEEVETEGAEACRGSPLGGLVNPFLVS